MSSLAKKRQAVVDHFMKKNAPMPSNRMRRKVVSESLRKFFRHYLELRLENLEELPDNYLMKQSKKSVISSKNPTSRKKLREKSIEPRLAVEKSGVF